MSQDTGYVKMPRSILQQPIWNNPYDCALYLYCVLNASHNSYKGLNPGEFYTSKIRVRDELHWSKNTLNEHLRHLELIGMITVAADEQRTLIRINHWEQFFGPVQEMPHGVQIVTVRGQQMIFDGQNLTPIGSAFDPNQEIYQEQPSTTKKASAREMAFEEWWSHYPRPDQKDAAKAKWMEMTDVSLDRLVAALENACATPQWQEQNGRYIPTAWKWLDGLWQLYENGSSRAKTVGKGGNPEWIEE